MRTGEAASEMLQVKLGTGQGWYSATEAELKAAAVAVAVLGSV